MVKVAVGRDMGKALLKQNILIVQGAHLHLRQFSAKPIMRLAFGIRPVPSRRKHVKIQAPSYIEYNDKIEVKYSTYTEALQCLLHHRSMILH